MRDDFSALCGITEQELLTQLKPDIEQMAKANGEAYAYIFPGRTTPSMLFHLSAIYTKAILKVAWSTPVPFLLLSLTT